MDILGKKEPESEKSGSLNVLKHVKTYFIFKWFFYALNSQKKRDLAQLAPPPSIQLRSDLLQYDWSYFCFGSGIRPDNQYDFRADIPLYRYSDLPNIRTGYPVVDITILEVMKLNNNPCLF